MYGGMIMQNSVGKAEEVFGESSVLADTPQMVTGGLESVFGTQYAISVAVLSALFVIYFVVFFDYVVYFFSTSFSIFTSGMSVQRNALRSVRNGLEFLMVCIGVAMISLFVVRFTVLYHPEWLTGIETGKIMWKVGLSVCGLFAFLMAVETLMIGLVGLTTGKGKLAQGILDLKLLHFASSLSVIFPFITVFMVLKGLLSEACLAMAVLVSAAFAYVYLKEVVALLREHRVSYFLCFLYLCILEIFPITLSLAPVLRGNVNF